ncbi:hypothetical protein K435DRAFT_651452 [Dendrothele bispora CBS 962.96]|uniref:Uncharacterized protein n=1 Tax=Dendrothele bispora (strain CBS 962.96) TaxID=1314807 RepID=A0A4V6T5M4_DENBC|nr:hypothetical protein K435DRAFT_651452 [Dendrothele bispora CBS 962.96]
MSTAPTTNSRASLLSGLRTGGVRSSSASIPHTAAPGGSFNVPRFTSSQSHSVFPEEDDDQVAEIPNNLYLNVHSRNHPMTAAVDGPNNRFSQQQSRGMNPNSVPFTPSFSQPNNVQTQALQMQMMQLEILRIQAIQAQQYQAELLAQAQRQAQAQAQVQNRRPSFQPPATAGPMSTSFDIRSATLSAQMRRANQTDQSHSQLGVGPDDYVPMTAALGGKFGSRSVSANMPNSMARYSQEDNDGVPPTPGSTTVISGGTSLGNLNSNLNGNTVHSKSDSVSSWRRGGKGNSVLANRSVTSPSVKITPPDATNAAKTRPQPLRFSVAVSQPLPTVTIDTSDGNDDDTSSTSSSKSAASHSSPTTPRSSSSNEIPLSPREEASKKLYEGLGIGRPVSNGGVEVVQDYGSLPASVVVVPHRMVSQPTRQPRGPPSGADELGPKNFATRIRRQAIGGLGALMGARERRELVEAF